MVRQFELRFGKDAADPARQSDLAFQSGRDTGFSDGCA
jgi:hypothetical protein